MAIVQPTEAFPIATTVAPKATITPYTIDIFKPVREAVVDAIGGMFAAFRVFLADTLGQVLVVIYTPFYMLLDLLIAFYQMIFGICDIIFGWLPYQLFLAILYAIILLTLNYILYLMYKLIRGA